jgi:hypothetical protein
VNAHAIYGEQGLAGRLVQNRKSEGTADFAQEPDIMRAICAHQCRCMSALSLLVD